MYETTRIRRATFVPALLALFLAIAITRPGLVAGARPAVAQADPGTPAADGTPAPDVALARAVEWLVSQQGADGGFAGFSGASDPAATTDAVYALKAAEVRGGEVEPALSAARDYLAREGAEYTRTGAGQAAKMVLAAVAVGVDPASFGAAGDVLGAIGDADPQTGLYGNGVFDHGLVLLALAAANAPVPPADVEALRATQLDDGSWAFDGSTDPGKGDSNTTALAIQALVAVGQGTDPMVEAALGYLKSLQAEGGGVAFQAGGPPDANSTALAVQAIVAAGQDPTSPEWRDAAGALAAFQNGSGAFRYTDAEPADNPFATVQAIPALAGLRLPVAVACPSPNPAAMVEGTPVSELPAPARGMVPCVELAPAA